MKSAVIVTLSIVGVLFTASAAIAVNSSGFSSVEQSRLGDQSGALTPLTESTTPTLASSAPGQATNTPEPVSISGEALAPLAEPSTNQASTVATVPAPPAAAIMPTPTPTYKSDDRPRSGPSTGTAHKENNDDD